MIERCKWVHSHLLEITPGLKTLIDDPSKSTDLWNTTKKVSMNSYEVHVMTTLIMFRWMQSLLWCVQMTLLSCANTLHTIWCQIQPPPQHCVRCHLWWVWRTRTSHVCFVWLKPPGSTTRVQLCTLYILLMQFFYWCFHRTRSQLEDSSIIMCTDAFPAFLWAHQQGDNISDHT